MTKNVSVNHRMKVRTFPFPPEISIFTVLLIIFKVEDGQCILPIPEERYDVETVLVIGGQEMIKSSPSRSFDSEIKSFDENVESNCAPLTIMHVAW